ncbi:helix-turn-helix domain-containing protein [Halobacillus andaensis]|nr:helix-turn-helix transcriptional regulator [Halobacillus andaensis]MBP2004483.1 transcriptional regulator with XRE-family HTH domain [Halobacillus andaensis]
MSEYVKTMFHQFGENLQNARNKQGLSLKQLAEKTGLNQQELEKVERVDLGTDIGADEVIILAYELKVHPTVLLEESEEARILRKKLNAAWSDK